MVLQGFICLGKYEYAHVFNELRSFAFGLLQIADLPKCILFWPNYGTDVLKQLYSLNRG